MQRSSDRPPEQPDSSEVDDAQLLRYSRHILLNEWGVEAQERVQAAHALVIGAGGLGSPALLYLAAAGVGRITVVDHDQVDLTNLQRQIAHGHARVGQDKAASARDSMAALNPDPHITAIVERADSALLAHWLPQVDVVLDCTDRFATRQLINRACVAQRKPLVFGAAIRFDAQLSVFDSRDPESPCYACVFAPDDAAEDAPCSTMGVFAPLTGIIGAMQAAEALKLLAGVGRSVQGRLLMLDARSMQWSEIRVKRRVDCAVCGTAH